MFFRPSIVGNIVSRFLNTTVTWRYCIMIMRSARGYGVVVYRRREHMHDEKKNIHIAE